MMVVGIVILYWTTMVVGSRSFNASHRRSTGLLSLWWWAIAVLMLLIEDQVYYRRSTVLLEDQISLEDQLLCWKIDCLLEDKLYYWKINCDVGRSGIFSEDAVMKTINRNWWKRSRKITARRWLHKYVGAECGASSFTWYLYQMCDTDVRPSVRPAFRVRSVAPRVLVGSISCVYISSSNIRRCVVCKVSCKNSKFFWFGIWCESLVWVIMGWRGVFQNAGVLVVLVCSDKGVLPVHPNHYQKQRWIIAN